MISMTEMEQRMTQTEKILTQAEDIARRTFENPTQETVMQLFSRLCDEADMAPIYSDQELENGTVH